MMFMVWLWTLEGGFPTWQKLACECDSLHWISILLSCSVAVTGLIPDLTVKGWERSPTDET